MICKKHLKYLYVYSVCVCVCIAWVCVSMNACEWVQLCVYHNTHMEIRGQPPMSVLTLFGTGFCCFAICAGSFKGLSCLYLLSPRRSAVGLQTLRCTASFHVGSWASNSGLLSCTASNKFIFLASICIFTLFHLLFGLPWYFSYPFFYLAISWNSLHSSYIWMELA